MSSTRRWTVPVAGFLAGSALVVAPGAVEATTGTASTTGTATGTTGTVAGTVYYVDSKAGDDAAAGTSAAAPWRSLDNVNAATLRPGTVVRLRRGGSWVGPLTLSARGTAAAPVTVEPYGTGAAPRIGGRDAACVVVTGSYVRVAGVRASNCQWSGFEVAGNRNELDRVIADRNITGVHFIGAHNVLKNAVLNDNDRMSVNDEGGDDDSGAFGVLLNGDDNLVTGNVITGSYAKSKDYGTDGAAVEVFNGDRNRITHNVARDNETFAELGARKGMTATGNVLAHNVVTSSRRGSFLVTRGPRHVVGPVKGTIAVHNSVHLPARDTMGWTCHHGCSPSILRLRNNVIVVGGQVGFEDGKGADEDAGVYRGRSLRFKLGPRSIVADPRFRSRTDLRLKPGSPALGRGVRLGPAWYGGAVMARDLSGAVLSAVPAAGAYQS
ncbi:right-handed parallel beta-helix repeat-containing protein [Streptosporangium sp. NPDC023615]|uniref:right-handed parallel beta-helix repeat-containing protein n=1 Tax=Streptosporangium sp. NPDC023615 TaxID=3154794 RepID=UPI00342D462D